MSGLLVCLAAVAPPGPLTLGAAAQEATGAEPDANEQPEARDDPDAQASADQPAEAQPGIEELRVLGRSAGAIQAEVPSSITQFDAATIEALGAQDISDLSRVTPNVTIVQPGATQATFFVRGIGLSDFQSNAAGAVTIFQDDVSLNAPAIQTGQLFDVEGIEVMRGPRGTGPFRNASAGAIRVRSRRPTGNYGANLRTTIGRYAADGGQGAHHALIQDYEGAVEMPLVSDWLSSRFAFRLRDAEPYKTNGCGNAKPFDQRAPRTGSEFDFQLDDICGERGNAFFPDPPGSISLIPTGLPRRHGDEHNWAARGTFRLQRPDSETELFLNGHGSMLDQDAALGQVIGTTGGWNVGVPNAPQPPLFGGRTASPQSGYWEPDIQEEFERLCNRAIPFNTTSPCTNPLAPFAVERQLRHKRPLDIRPYRGDYDRVGQTTRDAWGAWASGQTRVLGDIELFGLISYDQYYRTNDQDIDFTPDLLFEAIDDDHARQTYEELRARGELAFEPIEWELGGYYLQERLEVDALTLVHSGTAFIDIERTYSQSIQSFALWGDFGWDFADDFTLEGGVRWNYEKKEFDMQRAQVDHQGPGTPRSRVAIGDEDDETWQTPTGEIVLTYHLSETASAYARYTRGFKAGHFNALAQKEPDRPLIVVADPEYNDAWEAGVSGAWLNRRLSLLTSFFYYRYEDYQVFLFTDSFSASAPPVLEILNANEAENYGIELEGSLEPLRGWAPRFLEGLRLSGNFSWLHGEYLDFQQIRTLPGPSVGLPRIRVTVDYSGQPLQNSPEYKASGTVEWTFALGRWGTLIPRYDVNWSHDSFFDPNEGRGSAGIFGRPTLPEYAIGQRAFYLHNVRLGYRTPSGNIELAGWMRNVTDQVYKNYAFDVSTFVGSTIHFPGEPRTIGMDLSIFF